LGRDIPETIGIIIGDNLKFTINFLKAKIGGPADRWEEMRPMDAFRGGLHSNRQEGFLPVQIKNANLLDQT
jgi:hypothetical protein